MIITKLITKIKFGLAMTPEFRARAALFRWLWVMVGGLCLRLTAGNVFGARNERKYLSFVSGGSFR